MYTAILYCMMLNPNVNNEITNTKITELSGEVMEVTYYYADGSVRQTGFIQNNELTGTWTTFSPEGSITAKGYYLNGKKDGKWKVYDNAGNLVYKIYYRNGEKLWVQSFDLTDKATDMALR